MSDIELDEDALARGEYTLEEYDVGPSQQEMAASELASMDARMDRLPPSMNEGSMESRLRMAGEDGPPAGMQLTHSTGPGGEKYQTGPKGVKADYERAQQILRQNRKFDAMRRERSLQPQKTVTAESIMTPEERAAAQAEEEKQRRKRLNDDSDEDEEDDEDRAAFERYRQQRLQFLQNSLPSYGSYDRVSKGEFARLVKEVHEACFVVCHIYQNSIDACLRLHLSFEALAPQFPHVRFVRLRSTEAMPGFKSAGLPTFLIYKAGELVTSAVRVTDVLPKNFTDVDVAKLLQAKNILRVPTDLTSGLARLQESNREWSDEENERAAAEEEEEGRTSGFNLLSGASSSSSSSNSNRFGKSRLQRGKISIHRAVDHGSDSDSD